MPWMLYRGNLVVFTCVLSERVFNGHSSSHPGRHPLCNMTLLFLSSSIYFSTPLNLAGFVICFDQQNIVGVILYEFQSLGCKRPCRFYLFSSWTPALRPAYKEGCWRMSHWRRPRHPCPQQQYQLTHMCKILLDLLVQLTLQLHEGCRQKFSDELLHQPHPSEKPQVIVLKSLSFGVVCYRAKANGYTMLSGSSNSGTNFPQMKMNNLDWIIFKDVFTATKVGITTIA